MPVINGTGTGTITLPGYNLPSRILSFSIVNKTGGSITITVYVINNKSSCKTYTFTYGAGSGDNYFAYKLCDGTAGTIDAMTAGSTTRCAIVGTPYVVSGSGTISAGSACQPTIAITPISMTLKAGESYIRDSVIGMDSYTNLSIVSSGSIDYYFTTDVAFNNLIN